MIVSSTHFSQMRLLCNRMHSIESDVVMSVFCLGHFARKHQFALCFSLSSVVLSLFYCGFVTLYASLCFRFFVLPFTVFFVLCSTILCLICSTILFISLSLFSLAHSVSLFSTFPDHCPIAQETRTHEFSSADNIL